MMSARVNYPFAVMVSILHANPSCGGNAVGTSKELDRMMGVGDVVLLSLDPLHPLQDVRAGERAFRRDEGGRVLGRLFRHRLSDLERDLEIALLAAPRAAMAGTALDDGDFGRRQEPQHLGRLLAHILCPRVTGDVNGD